MASGINATFRQVGIATGIAGLGAIFSHTVRTQIESLLSRAPSVGARASHAIATGVSQGNGPGAGLAQLPASARPVAIHAVRASFVTGLNEVFLIGAILAFVASALTLVLIRSRDFEVGAALARPSAPHTVPAEQPVSS